MTRLKICADDYGYSDAVDAGILELLDCRGITAVSCLVTLSRWKEAAQKLKPFIARGEVEVGLHFNLTEGFPLTALPASHFGSIKKILIGSHLRFLKQRLIAAELEAQFKAFCDGLGRPPGFIDGHQHVHHFPVIRDALLAVYQKHFPAQTAWLRVSSNPLKSLFGSDFNLKKWVIALSGALSLRRRLNTLGIPYNPRFSGVYDFSVARPYGEHFEIFLKEVAGGGLIMCHPGCEDESSDDVLKASRPRELAFLLQRATRRE